MYISFFIQETCLLDFFTVGYFKMLSVLKTTEH